MTTISLPRKNRLSHRLRPFAARLRFARQARAAALAIGASALLFGHSAQAANTGDVFKTTATDLSVSANYSATPTITSDVQFSGSYTGGTTFDVNGAALNFGTLDDLDTTQSLIIGNTNATAGSITLNTAANSTAGSVAADLLFVKAGANLTLQNGVGTLTLNLVNTGNIDNAGTLSLASALNITAGKVITFTGTGATSVSGSFAATTGAVTVAGTGGTVTFSGTNLYTGNTVVNGGTLALDFSAAGAPASNIISGSSALTLGGGALSIKGLGGATTAQTFNGTTFTANTASTFTVNQNGATAVNVTLGGLTRNGGSTVDFTLPTAGTVTSTTTNATNGINTPSATGVAYSTANGGATWLANAAGTLGAFSAYTAGAGTPANYAAANNVDVTSGDSVSGVTVNTLRFNSASDALTLAGTNIITTGGILITPTGTGSTLSGGSLTSSTTAAEVIVHDYSSVNIGSVIANANAGATATRLTLTGTGTTTLSGANTYTGATAINGGTVILGVGQTGTTSGAFGATNTAALSLGNGATLDLGGNSYQVGTLSANSIGTNATLKSTAAATLTIAGGSSNLSTLTVNGAASLLVIGAGGGAALTTANATLIAGTGFLGFQNNTSQVRDNNIAANLGANGSLLFNGAGEFQNTTAQTFGSGNGVVVNGTGNQWNYQGATIVNGSLTGSGRLLLTQGFAVGITINGDMSAFSGTLDLQNAGTGSSNSSTFLSLGSGATTTGSALAAFTQSATSTGNTGTNTIQYSGTGSRTVNLGDLSTSGAPAGSFSSGTTRLQNATAATTATFSVGALNLNSTYAGTIIDGTGTTAITKVGTGAWTLTGANTYTGETTIANGKLLLANGTGTSATGAGAVNLGSATLGTPTNATISGTGFSTGLLTAIGGARIAPGINTTDADSSGRFNFGGAGTLTLGSTGGMTLTNASLDFDLASTAAGTNDRIATGGTTTLGTMAFTFNETGGSLQTGTLYTLISGGTISGGTGGITTTAYFNGTAYTASYTTDPTDLFVTFSPVPEPGTWAMVAGGAGLWPLRAAAGWPCDLRNTFFPDAGRRLPVIPRRWGRCETWGGIATAFRVEGPVNWPTQR